MYSRFLWAIWALLALAATAAGIAAQPVWDTNPWIIPALVVIGVVTLIGFVRGRLHTVVSAPVRGLRRSGALFWFALLVYYAVLVGAWLVHYQPTYGRPLKPVEYCYLAVIAWGFVYLIAYDLRRETLRAMGGQLSKGIAPGLLITLTTILFLFTLSEGYLRLFNITTDGYGFTAMNYHWYENFYRPYKNSLGFRDHEPKPDQSGLTRVAIVGDSFAAGHGINNIDDTFPQLLEQRLGAAYDVDLIAQSGWDMNDYTAWLAGYPLKPQIVVLSYYMNDIDWLLNDPNINPDAAFDFPKSQAFSWFVLNFFTPNYAYYTIAQFTSPARTTNFTNRLVAAYSNEAVWRQQAAEFDKFAAWNREHHTRVIVLVWPLIRDVAGSAPAVTKVKTYFLGQGMEVVDMSTHLANQDPNAMSVNRFDAHPSIAAQRLTADILYRTIMTPPGGS
jgi:hypothetical protein